ncbi:hypothetical protein [Micromonospora deserti]|uniref:hypothetical protein n=1 Tax=Micromonospora deserti TaxID=2070366 RepID=UPI0018F5761D|nr:hypothetical protein [Micromonospora deserti]
MTTTTAVRAASTAIAAPRLTLPSPRGGTLSALDSSSAAQVLAALPSLATWPEDRTSARRLVSNTSRMLEWLQPLAGGGWQARWQRAEELYGPKWQAWPLAEATAVGSGDEYRRGLTRGLGCLIKLRLVKPSYAFLTKYGPTKLFAHMRAEVSPDLFERAEQAARARGVNEHQTRTALNIRSAMVVHLGGDLCGITAEDMLAFQQAGKRPRARSAEGAHAAWQMLVDLEVLPAGTSLRMVLQTGQLTTTQLVDRYQIRNDQVRDLLIRYLDERRPGLDYSTFRGLVSRLVGQFWADIERHHAGIETINLPADVVQAWKERVRAPQRGRETKRHWDIFIAVRAFYRDIAEWALSDASWTQWAFPSPVRKRDTEGAAKQTRATVAAMHQRTRERLPNLPRLVDTAEQWKNDRAALLEAASRTAIGATVEHLGVKYRRVGPGDRPRMGSRRPSHVVVEDLADGALTNATIAEDEAFWAWAVIETLRHTGIRIEELLELTQLAVVSHRLADTRRAGSTAADRPVQDERGASAARHTRTGQRPRRDHQPDT